MKPCSKPIPTLTLLALLAAAPLTGAAPLARPPADEAPTLLDHLATLWSTLSTSAPTLILGDPNDPPGGGDDGHAGHDPNGIETPPVEEEEPTPTG